MKRRIQDNAMKMRYNKLFKQSIHHCKAFYRLTMIFKPATQDKGDIMVKVNDVNGRDGMFMNMEQGS